MQARRFREHTSSRTHERADATNGNKTRICGFAYRYEGALTDPAPMSQVDLAAEVPPTSTLKPPEGRQPEADHKQVYP